MQQKTRKILITGATGTLGQASARALASKNFSFVLSFGSSKEKAEKLKLEIEAAGASAHVISADISSVKQCESLVHESARIMGGMDVFIHAAAIFEHMPLGTVTEKQWDHTLSVDLKSVFFLSQVAGFAMRRAGGKIILFSDVAAVRPYAGYLPYCIAKAGVDALVKGLAKSLAPQVQVNAVAPYIVTRPDWISDKGWNDLLAKIPSRKPSTAEEIADVVRSLVFTGDSTTGQIVAVDGGRLLV